MRILIVDDEDVVRDYLAMLFKHEKYVVDKAVNGQDGFEKATQNTYDVILLDIIMPIKNGLDACKEIRIAGVHTPILILSSHHDESVKVDALDAGADDYMVKPFSSEELFARIRALLRRNPHSEGEEYLVGRLKLDTKTQRVELDGVEVVLRPKEYALIEFLIKYPNQVISKRRILDRVWSIPSTHASNRLEVCMYHLRKKFNKPGHPLVIETVKGYGYTLKV